MLAWLLAAGAVYTSGGLFFIYLTYLSYIFLAVGFLWRAAASVVYTACYYGSSKTLEWLFPAPRLVTRDYSQDQIRWYIKVSWFIHTTSTVLAIGVALAYWGLLCSDSSKSSHTSSTSTQSTDSPSSSYNNATNLTTSATCLHTATNLHVHGINAVIAFLDVWMSRVPFQLFHFFYTTILMLLYLIFTLIYWGAHQGTKSGVIYSVLDYGNNTYAGLYAIVVVTLPILVYLAVFGIVVLRDAIYDALRKLPCNKVHAQVKAGKRRSDAEDFKLESLQ